MVNRRSGPVAEVMGDLPLFIELHPFQPGLSALISVFRWLVGLFGLHVLGILPVDMPMVPMALPI